MPRRSCTPSPGCQIGATSLTATAPAATTRVLGAVFNGGDVAAGLRENLTSVVVLALAAFGRYLLDADARAAGPRVL